MERVVNGLFWLLLAAFVLEFSLNVRISTIPGLSLKNLAIYGLLFAMIIVIQQKTNPSSLKTTLIFRSFFLLVTV